MAQPTGWLKAFPDLLPQSESSALPRISASIGLQKSGVLRMRRLCGQLSGQIGTGIDLAVFEALAPDAMAAVLLNLGG